MSPSVVVGRAPDTKRLVAVTVELSPRAAEKMRRDAASRGLTTAVFARLLLEAAWSARWAPTGDAALDAAVARALAGGSESGAWAAGAVEAVALAGEVEAARAARSTAEARAAKAEAERDAAARDLRAALHRIEDLEGDRDHLLAASREREAALSERAAAAEAAAEAGRAESPAARGAPEAVRPASFAAVRGIRALAAAGNAAAAIAAALDLDVATVRAVLAETARARRDGGAR